MQKQTIAAAAAGASVGALAVLLYKRIRCMTACGKHSGMKRASASASYYTSPNPGWLDAPGQPSTSPYADSEIVTMLPEEVPKANLYAFVISAVVPRPVAFVSSVSAGGVRNLSPYSYFGCMGHNPPLLSIGICRSPSRGGGKKDTLTNVEETRELTVALISSWYVEAANHTCGEFPPEVDEWELSGLTPEPSIKVRPARVKEAALNMECVVRSITEIEGRDGTPTTAVVLAEVVAFHVSKGVLTTSPTGKPVIDPVKIQAVSRLGGISYALCNTFFNLPRPAGDGSYPPAR